MINKLYLDPTNRVGQSIKDLKITKLKDYSSIQSLNHNFSFIQMNSVYIELVNRNYLWKGKLISYFVIGILPYFILIFCFGLIMICNRPDDNIVIIIILFYIFIFILSSVLLYIFSSACVRLEYVRPIYEPIIFIRINKKIFV